MSGIEVFSKNANVVFIEKSEFFSKKPRLLWKPLVFGNICIFICIIFSLSRNSNKAKSGVSQIHLGKGSIEKKRFLSGIARIT